MWKLVSDTSIGVRLGLNCKAKIDLFRFSLELVENDIRKNYRWTNEVPYKTAAVPKVVNLDARRITVGYRWDPVKHVSDLKQASIKIPKSLIQNPNCLDYVQVGINKNWHKTHKFGHTPSQHRSHHTTDQTTHVESLLLR